MNSRIALFASSALFVTPAFADDAAILKRLDAMQHMLELQQKQIAEQRGEITALKGALRRKGATVASPRAETAQAEAPPPIEKHIAQQQIAIDELLNKFAALEDRSRVEKADQPVWSMAGGRPSVASADGRFSLAIRVLGQ
jgi:hypothetical protein